MARPATPIPAQNKFHVTPAVISGPDDELAGRATSHAEHLSGPDERGGRGWPGSSWWR